MINNYFYRRQSVNRENVSLHRKAEASTATETRRGPARLPALVLAAALGLSVSSAEAETIAGPTPEGDVNVNLYYNAPASNGLVSNAKNSLISAGSVVENSNCDCSSMAGVLSITLDHNCDGVGDNNGTLNLNEDLTWNDKDSPSSGTWSQNGCELLLYDEFITPPIIWTGNYKDGQISGTYAGVYSGCWWGTPNSAITVTCGTQLQPIYQLLLDRRR